MSYEDMKWNKLAQAWVLVSAVSNLGLEWLHEQWEQCSVKRDLNVTYEFPTVGKTGVRLHPVEQVLRLGRLRCPQVD
jgi:hypothetical protein